MAYDEDVANRIREALQGERGVVEKRMFGGLAFMVGGHMAVAASGSGGLMLRVDPARHDDLLRESAAEPFTMNGRELAGWLRVQVDSEMTDEHFAEWVSLGVDFVHSLPPK